MRRGLLLLGAAGLLLAAGVRASDRPNILWITCEDTGPHLGAYGDAFAVTPHLDALAKEGVRYTQAFAYTGVCAPSRSCLITGVLPLRLGSHPMRSTTQLPSAVRPFPAYLREAGYHATNNAKEDYNFKTPPGSWDESGPRAHWRSRRPGQPFFAVFNFTVTHQSQIFCPEARYQANTRRLRPEQRRNPAQVTVPPIHPDTPEFRREWARHYENVTAMDLQVGDLLAELERDGLAEETLVFFFSDHGTGMPGIKMWAWGPGLHVPLLARFPERWRHLAPAAPGGTVDRLVTFVDFAPTMLSLAGVPAPAHFQGTAFLGPAAGAPREWIFGGKDRQGEAPETVRYVRDGRFQYLRNFQPHLPYAQYLSYLWQHASTRAWEQRYREGTLTGPAARFFAESKPAEELYDVARDPWQVHNLAAEPAHAEDLARLRALLRREMLAAGDLGLLPEGEMRRRAAGRTPYELATDPAGNPLPELLRAADLAGARDPRHLAELSALLRSPDAALRWWGATGLLALRAAAGEARPALTAAFQDPSPDVRLAVAEALARLGPIEPVLPVFRAALQAPDAATRLVALVAAGRLGRAAAPLVPDIRGAALKDPAQPDAAEYVGRMVEYLPGRLAP
jgi:uncharacterized sulfatase